MRTEQFLRDYFTEDEHFIIALKTLPAVKDKKAYMNMRQSILEFYCSWQ